MTPRPTPEQVEAEAVALETAAATLVGIDVDDTEVPADSTATTQAYILTKRMTPGQVQTAYAASPDLEHLLAAAYWAAGLTDDRPSKRYW